MAKGFAVAAGFAMLAGCGVTDLYPPVGNGGGAGVVGGRSGSSGGNTNGNPVGGNTGTVGGVGTVGGNTAGNTNGRNPGSSTGRINTVGGNTVGGNTGSVGGIGSSTGRGFTTGGIGSSAGNGSTGNNGTTGGGGCTPLLGACDPSVGCGCGNDCVFDEVLDEDVCEATCTNHPCTNPKTLCNGTNCTLIPCGPVAGNGSYDGACSADGNPNDQDGTCVPLPTTDAGGAFCELAGTSDGGCDPDATRSQPGSLCVQGDFCFPGQNAVDFVCYTLCDPNNDGTALCQDDGFDFCAGLPGTSLGVCVLF